MRLDGRKKITKADIDFIFRGDHICHRNATTSDWVVESEGRNALGEVIELSIRRTDGSAVDVVNANHLLKDWYRVAPWGGIKECFAVMMRERDELRAEVEKLRSNVAPSPRSGATVLDDDDREEIASLMRILSHSSHNGVKRQARKWASRLGKDK